MVALVVMVINDSRKTDAALDAWTAAGVSGVTCLESKGLAHFVEAHSARDDVPLFPSMKSLLSRLDESYNTLLAVVPDGFDVDALVTASERIVGRFDEPGTGILFVVPVTTAWGLHRK
jgi:hypothetical protein